LSLASRRRTLVFERKKFSRQQESLISCANKLRSCRTSRDSAGQSDGSKQRSRTSRRWELIAHEAAMTPGGENVVWV
jgi:hypothetical protein